MPATTLPASYGWGERTRLRSKHASGPLKGSLNRFRVPFAVLGMPETAALAYQDGQSPPVGWQRAGNVERRVPSAGIVPFAMQNAAFSVQEMAGFQGVRMYAVTGLLEETGSCGTHIVYYYQLLTDGCAK